tara:strand:+ start:399 stop:566 length:168 start_codon:yes stop_codon:yes gene_type:complete
MKRQKRVWDKKTGGLIYVDSVKDFLDQQQDSKVEAPVVEEEVVEEAAPAEEEDSE